MLKPGYLKKIKRLTDDVDTTDVFVFFGLASLFYGLNLYDEALAFAVVGAIVTMLGIFGES